MPHVPPGHEGFPGLPLAQLHLSLLREQAKTDAVNQVATWNSVMCTRNKFDTAQIMFPAIKILGFGFTTPKGMQTFFLRAAQQLAQLY